MKALALKLIDNMMDFEYERSSSGGEKIKCCELGLTLRSNEGCLQLAHDEFTSTLKDDEQGWERVMRTVQEIIEDATT